MLLVGVETPDVVIIDAVQLVLVISPVVGCGDLGVCERFHFRDLFDVNHVVDAEIVGVRKGIFMGSA